MHFCFSSMSYNLIRNFWCIAGYLNIKVFRWSHWISHPCEIPWDVSCCLSVWFSLSLSLFLLSLLSRISIRVFWCTSLTHCLSTPTDKALITDSWEHQWVRSYRTPEWTQRVVCTLWRPDVQHLLPWECKTWNLLMGLMVWVLPLPSRK